MTPMRAQGVECGRRRRITSNHETANASLNQRGRTLQGIAHDRFRALGAVRESRSIAKIDEALGGHGRTQRTQHGQPADARVEYADRYTRQISGRM